MSRDLTGLADAASETLGRRSLLGAEPIGMRLVRFGQETPGAVSHALRRQLVDRLARVFLWPRIEIRFRSEAPARRDSVLPDPPSTSDTVLRAARALAATKPVATARRHTGHGAIRLTRLGRDLVRRGLLWPHEIVLTSLLSRSAGSTVDDCLSAVGSSPGAIRSLCAFRTVGAIGPLMPAEDRFGLLLRKKRQLERRASARELLELPRGATRQQARCAVRHFARVLHPDRFGDTSPSAARIASEEVLRALLRASELIEALPNPRCPRF